MDGGVGADGRRRLRERVRHAASSVCAVGVAAGALLGCGSIACTAQGPDAGVFVTVTDVVPEVDTRMDAQVCVRSVCTTDATTITAGSAAQLFVPVALESEDPVDAQIVVHAGAGEPLARTRLMLEPFIEQPNGPGCDPTVHQATVELPALRPLD